MKKKVLFILACFWIIISFLLIRITYAKYLTAMSGSSDAHVSFWNITLNNQDILSNSNFSSNISLVFPGDTYRKANVIVPGGIGYFDLTIDTSTVSIPYKYSVTVTPAASNDIDDIDVIGYSLDGNNNNITYLTAQNTEIANTVYPNTLNSSIRVYVQWVDGGQAEVLNDIADTNIALDGGNAVITVTVDFEQVPALVNNVVVENVINEIPENVVNELP